MIKKSWMSVPPTSDFSLQNIPFGIVKSDQGHSAATRIGDEVIHLAALQAAGYLEDQNLPRDIFKQPYLNDFIALGKPITHRVREKIQSLFTQGSTESLQANTDHLQRILRPASKVEMSLPVRVGDYTDFYSSEQHAFNVGCMFRDPDNALMPNWKHLPVAYHGRSSSIVVSGTPFRRPKGQQKPHPNEPPVFGASRCLDFELEMAFVLGKSTQPGESLSTAQAEAHIFGLCLFNDWSARDLQKWEYVPLGPFLAKNFISHISPWIVTLEALQPFQVEGPSQHPQVLPYLTYEGHHHYDIALKTYIETESGASRQVSHSNFKHMYWNMLQQLAHHTVNGCNVNVGDLMASGTISGPKPENYGSMLELSWQGTRPIAMPDGTERKFIQDGDTVIMKGRAEKNGLSVGFGEVSAQVLPAD